jgi:predicted NBD/HSP70 family sugar kinase
MPKYVGLDVHLRNCHATVMNEHGEILKQEKFPNERRELERICQEPPVKDRRHAKHLKQNCARVRPNHRS